MRAHVFKDPDGFWAARIEERPAREGFGGVWRRQTLPVPPSASASQAADSLARLLDDERRRHGLR